MPSHPRGPNPCSLWVSPTDAIYDCYSLYQKNYRISGVYKLPPDEFLGSPELEVGCYCHVLPFVLKGLVYRKGDSEKQCSHRGAYESAQFMGFLPPDSSHLLIFKSPVKR